MTGVLVTRPEPGAGETAAAIAALGHVPVLAPLLTIAALPGPMLDLSPYDGIAVTSANGVRALAGRSATRDLPIYAVGARTAALARDLGFTRVQAADGDVASLSALITRAGAAHILHAAGADLAGDLRPDGVTVARLMLYRAAAVASLPDPALAALRNGQVAYVTLFSPRTAAGFVRLAEKAGLSPLAGGWTALCLSAAVADAASGFGFADIRVADRPDAASLLALLPAVKGVQDE